MTRTWNFDPNLGGAFVEERDDATRVFAPLDESTDTNVDDA